MLRTVSFPVMLRHSELKRHVTTLSQVPGERMRAVALQLALFISCVTCIETPASTYALHALTYYRTRSSPRASCVRCSAADEERAKKKAQISNVGTLDEDKTTGIMRGMYDSIGMASRPSLWSSLDQRDWLTLAFLSHGVLVSAANVMGKYDGYEIFAVGAAAVLGLASAGWGVVELLVGLVPNDERPGFAHERTIRLYCTEYLALTVWLSLRFSTLYPAALLAQADPALCIASIFTYCFGFASPVYTAQVHWDELTSTEQLRMKGMIVSGAVGSVFTLEATALLVNGADWWTSVMARYQGQCLLEPSVTLFAAYAVEAGMLIHRCARKGVLTFAEAVPFYGTVVLPLLTLLPMASLFWWKKDEVSFWNFLFT